jgi:hypothetical protein
LISWMNLNAIRPGGVILLPTAFLIHSCPK